MIQLMLIMIASCVPLVDDGSDAAVDDDQVQSLLAALDSDNQLIRQEAIIELTSIGAAAKPGVDKLCVLLGSQSFAERSLSSEALVSIGEPSIEPVKLLLSNDAPRVRAAAIHTLAKLDAVEFAQLRQFESAPDARVRASLANALGKFHDRKSVSVLNRLMADTELAVAAQAVVSLKGNSDHSDVVVESLSRAVSREPIAAVVVETLGSYGTKARAAVPSILRSLNAAEVEWKYPDLVEEILGKIGPPDDSDVTQVAKMLDPTNVESTILVANTLAHCHKAGAVAAADLESTIEQLLVQYEKYRAAESNAEKEMFAGSPGRIIVAAETCAVAHWHVSQDAKKLIQLIDAISTRSKRHVTFNLSSPWDMHKAQCPWDSFPDDQIPLIGGLLESDNASTVESGLHAVVMLGERANQLAPQIVRVSQKDLKYSWTNPAQALSSLGPDAASLAAPAIWQMYVEEKIDLDNLAKSVVAIDFATPEIENHLNKQVKSKTGWTAAYCMKALCCISTTPEKTAALVIESDLTARQKISALRRLQPLPESAVNFFIGCIKNPEVWARHESIREIGEIRPMCKQAIDPLKKLLKTEQHKESRFQAAKVLYLLTENADILRKEIETSFQRQENPYEDRDLIAETIGELEAKGEPFVPLLVQHKAWYIDNNQRAFFDALGSVGGAESIRVLSAMLDSKYFDAKIRAKRTLKSLKQRGEAILK